MAILNAVEKRDILFGVKKVTQPQLLSIAKAYEQEAMLNDAAEFFHQAQSKADLSRLLKIAEEDGDVFLWLKVHRWLGEAALDSNSLRRCTELAEKGGKNRYALLGYQKLGIDSEVARIKESLKDDGDFQAILEAEVFLAENPEEILDLEEEESDA
jgi:hypothetical protein